MDEFNGFLKDVWLEGLGNECDASYPVKKMHAYIYARARACIHVLNARASIIECHLCKQYRNQGAQDSNRFNSSDCET